MQITKLFKQSIRDEHGRIVIWQKPNFLLWLWLGLKLLLVLIDDRQLKTNFGHFSSAVLFAWAYLEVTKGDSLFRRVLGFIVIVLSTATFFA